MVQQSHKVKPCLLNTQKDLFLSPTRHVLGHEPSEVIPTTIPITNAADRLSLRPNALHLAITRDVAFERIAIVVRVARVAIKLAELEILVVSNVDADSYVSFVPANKAKGAIGVEGEFGWRCRSIEGYA